MLEGSRVLRNAVVARHHASLNQFSSASLKPSALTERRRLVLLQPTRATSAFLISLLRRRGDDERSAPHWACEDMSLGRFVERHRASLLLVSLFLLLFGSRALLIRYAGYSTPFLDEWEADGATLLKPYLAGHLGVGDLFVPISEHRIPFTKLAVLAAYQIAGYWDVVLQMIINALADSATVVAVAYALSRALPRNWAVAAMILSVAINAVPYGYDNAVLGFNTHFYLLLTFSFVGLWLLADSRAWSPRWALGVLFAAASSMCLASGALTLSAAAAAQGMQMACGRRAGLSERVAIAALVAFSVALISIVPHVPVADELRAHSVGQALVAFGALASWPSHSLLGLILFLPSAIFVWRVFAERPPLSDPRWFNVMALAWVVSQILSLAIGRAQLPLQTRYADILLVGVTINLVSAFWLFQWNAAQPTPKPWGRLSLAAWLGLLALSLTHPQRHLPSQIEEWRTILAAGQSNVRDYLSTGDPAFATRAPAREVPSYDPGKLRELLDTPEIRAALPPDLTGKAPPRLWLEAVKEFVLRAGPVWLGLAVVLLIAVLASGTTAPAAPRTRPAPRSPA